MTIYPSRYADATRIPDPIETTELVVRVSHASMPGSCMGRYVHVAVMEVAAGYTPHEISDRHPLVVRVVQRWGRLNVGRRCSPDTRDLGLDRRGCSDARPCAYHRALAEAAQTVRGF